MEPFLVDLPTAGDILTFRVEGNCQAPRIEDGDVVAVEFVGTLVHEVHDFEPGEMIVIVQFGTPELSGAVKGKAHLVTCSPGDEHGGIVVGRHGRKAEPGTEATNTVHAGLDLWFRQDVARILASTWTTMRACVNAATEAEGTRPGAVATSDERLAAAYRRGFEDALQAVGVAFGLAEGSNGHSSEGFNSGVSMRPPEYPCTWEG